MKKNIEVEIRAEVKFNQFEKILKQLKSLGKLSSKTRRLSVMFFGVTDGNNYDVRVRVTNGEYEVVVKKGDFHSHNRSEASSQIEKNQFLNQVKIFSQFFSDIKVGERETHNFDFSDGIVVSLVKAGKICYVELEKMSSQKDVEENKKELSALAQSLNLELIETSEQYVALCNRLTEKVDWRFHNKKSDYEKLEELLKKY